MSCDYGRRSAAVHIPKAKREEVAAAFADCLEGSLDGEETWATLQQALFKVVLYGIPSGITADAEITARMTLWSDGRWEELPVRVEAQAGQRGANIARDNTMKQRSAAAARVKRLAREGARSKAVGGLQGASKPWKPVSSVSGPRNSSQHQAPGGRFINRAATPPQHHPAARERFRQKKLVGREMIDMRLLVRDRQPMNGASIR